LLPYEYSPLTFVVPVFEPYPDIFTDVNAVAAYQPCRVELFDQALEAPDEASPSKFCVTGAPNAVIDTCPHPLTPTNKNNTANSSTLVIRVNVFDFIVFEF